MYVATFMAPAGQLTSTKVAHYQALLQASLVTWLSPAEAADLLIETPPADFERLWQEAQSDGIDVVVQPAEGRRKRLLMADMDSTMIGQECIDELADVIGQGDQVRQITAKAMNGEIAFDGALRARVALLAGHPIGVVDEVIANRLSMTVGGDVLVKTMKGHGAFTALVSGGFTDFTRYVAENLGFDAHRANVLRRHQNAFTGEVEGAILGREAKVQALDEFTMQLGISAQEVIAVGDGANDLGMLSTAGMGVALHAKPNVARQCKARVNFCDLTALLFIQGYARDAFLSG